MRPVKPELPISAPEMWQSASEICQQGDIQEPVEFHGGIISASVAVRTGWQSLRNVFREWGIASDGDLPLWFRANGFPRAQVGNHISARTQEVFLLKPPLVTHALHCWSQSTSCSRCIEGARMGVVSRGEVHQCSPLQGPAVHDAQNPYVESWSIWTRSNWERYSRRGCRY